MTDLKTTYLGLKLKNPIIAGSCNLSTDPDVLKRLEDSGAAAVVYKSLFEEQIQLERYQMDEDLDEYAERSAEMLSIFPNLEHAGPQEHLENLRKAKSVLGIPLIASLNAVYKESWVDYAQQLEQTGVDALELNFYSIPNKFDKDSKTIELEQIDIIKAILGKVKIPVSVKLSLYYTNPLNFIKQVDDLGVKGFVLFNKLFQPEINIEDEKHITPWNLSEHNDKRVPLRFAGLLYSRIKAQICSSTGIYEGKDVAAMILAGADAVQVVSALYRHKPEHIAKMLEDLTAWMEKKGYSSLESFRGKLSAATLNDPFIYKRAQYVDALLGSGSLLKKTQL
ncbi:MAG: dihydroorotate dehydrogenase-like protein [Bacteroidales bacterium]